MIHPTDAAVRDWRYESWAEVVGEASAGALAADFEDRLAETYQREAQAEARKRSSVGHKDQDQVAADNLYGLFKVLVGDGARRRDWQRLRSEKPAVDRDRAVCRLWSRLESRHSEPVRRIAGLAYHRAWLLHWFLGRYDVRRARRAVGGGSLAAGAHLLLVAGLAGLTAAHWLGRWPTGAIATTAGVIGLYLAAWGIVAWGFRGQLTGPLEAAVLALQTLLPRLAGACAVGLLILASSEEFLDLVVAGLAPRAWPALLPWAVGLAYLLLDMARRLHPLPTARSLLKRGADVGLTALAHAVALTLVAEPGLRHILARQGQGAGLEPAAFVTLTGFVFVIGLIVNLIWAEAPVTDPL